MPDLPPFLPQLVLAVFGAALVVVGVGLWYMPAGVVVAGCACVVAAWLWQSIRAKVGT